MAVAQPEDLSERSFRFACDDLRHLRKEAPELSRLLCASVFSVLQTSDFRLQTSNFDDLLTANMSDVILMLAVNMGVPSDIPYGTLDLMVLKTLQSLGPQHGFGIARRIEQMARGILSLNQGTIYPALLRLEQQGLIRSSWGTSDNNRRAKFYEITRAREKHLAAQARQWARMVSLVSRLLEDAT